MTTSGAGAIFNIGVIWFTRRRRSAHSLRTSRCWSRRASIQGVGGALLTPGSLAIIEATFHRDDRARAIGAWSALGGVAAAVGPLLGGYLIEAVSWRAIFLINLPLGAFVVYQARRHVPETRDPTVTGPLDIRGSALAALGTRRFHVRADSGARAGPRLRPGRRRARPSASSLRSSSSEPRGAAPDRCFRSTSSARASSRAPTS